MIFKIWISRSDDLKIEMMTKVVKTVMGSKIRRPRMNPR